MHFLWALHEEIYLHTIHWLAIFTEQKVIMWEKTICLPTSPPLQEDNVYKRKIPIISGLLFCSSLLWLNSLPTLVTASRGLWSTFLYVSVSSGLQRGPGVKNKRQNHEIGVTNPRLNNHQRLSCRTHTTPTQHGGGRCCCCYCCCLWLSQHAGAVPRPAAEGNPLLSMQLSLCKWFCSIWLHTSSLVDTQRWAAADLRPNTSKYSNSSAEQQELL